VKGGVPGTAGETPAWDDQQKHAEPRDRRVLGSAKRECERFGLRHERRALNEHWAV
jgi:hypothetical protein